MIDLSHITLEHLFTATGFAGIAASPLQLAICRAADGRPIGDILSPEQMVRHFGAETVKLAKPRILTLVCGIRSGKTFLAACRLIHSALTANLSYLRSHEVPRAVIVAPRLVTAAATFRVLRGIIETSPALSAHLDGEPTADTLMIRRDDGRRVELRVVAASQGGVTIRNVWLTSFVLEEVGSFGSESEGVAINAEQLYHAAQTRLLDGCQGCLISSPGGPSGLLFDQHRRYFGKFERQLVVWAPTREMNPSVSAAEIEAIRKENPDVAAREYDASFIESEASFLEAQLVDNATRAQPLERAKAGRGRCYAGLDAGSRGNATTLSIAWAERWDGGTVKTCVAGVWQWQGSKTAPLAMDALFGAIKSVCKRYDVTKVHCDRWSFDANQALAKQVGLELVEQGPAERDEAYARLRTLLSNGWLELPPVPQLRADLLALRKKPTPKGVTIELPKTADGRHCDFAPALALSVLYADRNAGAPNMTPEERNYHQRAVGAVLGGGAGAQYLGIARPRDPHEQLAYDLRTVKEMAECGFDLGELFGGDKK